MLVNVWLTYVDWAAVESVMLAGKLLPPVPVNVNCPVPPTVCFRTMIVPRSVSVKLQVTKPPAGSVKPAGAPLVQLEAVRSQPLGAPSVVEEQLAGRRFVDVWLTYVGCAAVDRVRVVEGLVAPGR